MDIENNKEIEFRYSRFKKCENQLLSLPVSDRDIKLMEYSMDEDPNKRAVAAKYGENLEYLIDDENFDVLKILARHSAEYSEDIARYFFNGNDSELKMESAISLASQNMLKDSEFETLDAPILRAFIKRRLCLMQIAKVHKTGEIKELLNRELYRMSRFEHKDVTELRNELNSQPFITGDYMYKMDFDLDDLEIDTEESPFDAYLRKDKAKKEKQEQQILNPEEVENNNQNLANEEPPFTPKNGDSMSLDDLLASV